jgi:hypothetical protein
MMGAARNGVTAALVFCDVCRRSYDAPLHSDTRCEPNSELKLQDPQLYAVLGGESSPDDMHVAQSGVRDAPK